LAIYELLEDTAFGPEDVKVIITTYQAALKALHVIDDTGPMADLIAKNILDVARQGERDPVRLYEKALGPTKAFAPAMMKNCGR
jgi:hypothetical protein